MKIKYLFYLLAITTLSNYGMHEQSALRQHPKRLTINLQDEPSHNYYSQAPRECCSDKVNNAFWDTGSFIATSGGTGLVFACAVREAISSVSGVPAATIPIILILGTYWGSYIPSTGKQMVKSLKNLCSTCTNNEQDEHSV